MVSHPETKTTINKRVSTTVTSCFTLHTLVLVWCAKNVGNRSGSNVENGMNEEVFRESATSIQKIQFQQEGTSDDFCPSVGGELVGSHGRAARRNDVVVDEHAIAATEGVDVHFDRVGAVFECVLRTHRLVGKFALFADRYETGLQASSEQAPEDKSTGLDTDYLRDAASKKGLGEGFDRLLQKAIIGQHRGDVLELDAGLREVRHISNGAFEFLDINHE